MDNLTHSLLGLTLGRADLDIVNALLWREVAAWLRRELIDEWIELSTELAKLDKAAQAT